MTAKKKAWVITDGKIGCIRQAEGLALALGVEFESKIVRPKCYIPQYPAWIRDKMIEFVEKDNHKLSSPWPDIVIACGSKTIPFALNMKKKSKEIYLIYVQHPHNALKDFDSAIVMEHDRVYADNTIRTVTALHPITKDSLSEAKDQFKKRLPSVPFHQNAIIIGGDTPRSKMTEKTCVDLIEKIKFIRNHHKGGLFISPSRRTPKRMVDLLNKHFGEEQDVYIVNLHDSYNPYFGILAIAKRIFVTNDSISMVSEACASGKEVFILPLQGFKIGKTKIFIQTMLDKNLISNFTDPPPKNSITDNTKQIAELLKERMIESGSFKSKDFL